jgi:hypothetical protein
MKNQLEIYNFKKFQKSCKDITNAQINCTYANATKKDKALVRFAGKNKLIYIGGKENK